MLQALKERADFDSYKPRPFNMREFYDRTGHDIKDMLLSCYYRGVECSAEDFKVVSGEAPAILKTSAAGTLQRFAAKGRAAPMKLFERCRQVDLPCCWSLAQKW